MDPKNIYNVKRKGTLFYVGGIYKKMERMSFVS